MGKHAFLAVLVVGTLLLVAFTALTAGARPVAGSRGQMAADAAGASVLPTVGAADAPDVDAPLPPAAPLDAGPDVEVVPSSTAVPEVESTEAPVEPTPAPSAATEVVPTATLPPPPASTPAPILPTATPALPRPTPTLAPSPPVTLTPMEAEIFAGQNAARSANGGVALQLDGRLVALARQRAQDMATQDYFSHTAPNGQTIFDLLDRTDYPYALAGENIARNNYPDAQSMGVALSAFLGSPGHRMNLLDPRFGHVGVGVAVGAAGMKYVAVVFAN